jgi:hypothetical protein
MARSKMRSESISSAALILFSIFIVIESRDYPLGTVDNPGPGFLPLLLGAVLGLMSILLLFKTLIKGRSRICDTSWPGRERFLKISVIFTGILLFTLFLEVTGYLLNIFLLFLILLRPVGRQKWPSSLGISIGAVLISYLLFDWWLRVPLPRGIWFH